jgi:hypothetical protein
MTESEIENPIIIACKSFQNYNINDVEYPTYMFNRLLDSESLEINKEGDEINSKNDKNNQKINISFRHQKDGVYRKINMECSLDEKISDVIWRYKNLINENNENIKNISIRKSKINYNHYGNEIKQNKRSKNNYNNYVEDKNLSNCNNIYINSDKNIKINQHSLSYFCFLITDYMQKKAFLLCSYEIANFQKKYEKTLSLKLLFLIINKRIIFNKLKFMRRFEKIYKYLVKNKIKIKIQSK